MDRDELQGTLQRLPSSAVFTEAPRGWPQGFRCPLMRTSLWHKTFMAECAGYTLVESVVALSLFVSVFIPMAGTLSYFITQHRNEQELLALAMGQRFMEETLSSLDCQAREVWMEGKRWRLRRDVQAAEGLAIITIGVYRSAQPRPLVELTTMRRLP